MDTDEFIAATMKRVAASAAPRQPATVAPTARRHWFAPLAVVTGVVDVIVAAAGVISSQRSGPEPIAPAPATTSPSTTGCRVDYSPQPLPQWARAGFTPPTQPMPYVLGDHGDIAAILWDPHHPLVAPPAVDKSNKILWVARVGAAEGPLLIRATSANTGRTVTRTVGGAPGPSIIDLPSAGCWSFELSWGSHRDHLMLGYAAR